MCSEIFNSGSKTVELSFAEFCDQLLYDDIPNDVIARCELLLSDVVSCMLLAAGDEQFRQLATKISVESLGSTSAIGVGSVSPDTAVQVNAIAAHWNEWDDVYDEGALHITAVVVPALLAAAGTLKRQDSLEREFLTAMVAAIEISCRIGKVLISGLKTGWMPTGIACAIGAAAGVAKLQGGSRNAISDAMGLAAAASGALRQPLADAVSGKSVLCSQVAQNAYGASQLALAGVRGATNFLSGRFGVATLFLDREVALHTGAASLGSEYELHNVKLKQYPSCRATHEAIDTALALVEELSRQGQSFGEIDAIENVSVAVSPQAFYLCGSPYSEGSDMRVSRQFSIAYMVAAALIQGDITPSSTAAKGTDQAWRIDSLAKRTEVLLHENTHMTSGRSVTKIRVLYCNGAVQEWAAEQSPAHPRDDYELVKKKLSFVDRELWIRVRRNGLFLSNDKLKVDIDSLVRKLGTVT